MIYWRHMMRTLYDDNHERAQNNEMSLVIFAPSRDDVTKGTILHASNCDQTRQQECGSVVYVIYLNVSLHTYEIVSFS